MSADTKKRKPRAILDEQIDSLQRMLEASKVLSSTLDLAHLTEIILQIVRQKVPVDRVTAFMVERKSRILRSVVAQGVGDYVIRLPIGSGIAGTVAQTGEILDIPDAYNDSRFYPGVDRLLHYHTRDIFCLPILSRDLEIVGVLELLNRERPIDDSDKAFLRDVSTHIGLALELAWSHREVLEKQKLEEGLQGLRERLVEVDRLQLMGELLGNVMHELNNPLAILVGNVGLLKTQLDLTADPKVGRYIETIEMAADRSAATVRNFLNFVEAPLRKRHLLDLPDVLRQTLALRDYGWSRAGIEVIDEIQHVPAVVANQEEMQHVFLILLKNAEEAVMDRREKARITLKCSYDEDTERVRVDISDNGGGIPPEVQARIFLPVFTMKPKGSGTGLGLMVARRIIEEHEGRIWLETKKDIGTTVSIELPRGQNS